MKFHKGVTLVGSLVAITILTISLVSVFNLQVSIIRGKDYLKNNNTASLLASEGIEIVRAIFTENVKKDIQNNKTPSLIPNGKYALDYNSSTLTSMSAPECTATIINNNCDLDSNGGYKLSSNNDTLGIFYRFIVIKSIGNSKNRVTSTVIVRNPKGGPLKVYKAYADLYIN